MTTFIPTQEQIKQAQECGNAAHAMCTNQVDQAIVYREMYDRTMRRFEVEALRDRNANAAPVAGRFVGPAVTLELDAESAALLAQHNAEVDRRKANGDKRNGGMTYTSLLEQAQREGKV